MDWMQIATQLGVPVACMAVLALAIWRVAVWAGSHVLMPLVTSHIQFLSEVTTELKKQTEAYGVQSRVLQEMNAKLSRPG